MIAARVDGPFQRDERGAAHPLSLRHRGRRNRHVNPSVRNIAEHAGTGGHELEPSERGRLHHVGKQNRQGRSHEVGAGEREDSIRRRWVECALLSQYSADGAENSRDLARQPLGLRRRTHRAADTNENRIPELLAEASERVACR